MQYSFNPHWVNLDQSLSISLIHFTEYNGGGEMYICCPEFLGGSMKQKYTKKTKRPVSPPIKSDVALLPLPYLLGNGTG